MRIEKIPTPISLEDLLEGLETGFLLEIKEEDKVRIHAAMSEADVVRYYQAVGALEDDQRQKVLDGWIPRPKILYHASHNGSIETFEPREESKRHPNDPPRIYASPMETVSSMFLLEQSNTDISGSYDGGKTWVLVAKSIEDLKRRNQKGYIYTFDPGAFSADVEKGLGLYEWFSEKSIVPTNKEETEPALQEMLKLGVEIYIPSSEVPMEKFQSGDQALLLSKMRQITLEDL